MKQVRRFFILTWFFGAAAFLWVFLTPSEAESAVFLWLSPAKLFLLGFIALLCMALLVGYRWLARSSIRQAALQRFINRWFLEEKRLVLTILYLLVPATLILTVVTIVVSTPLDYSVYGQWAPHTFPFLHSSIIRLLPVIVWILAVILLLCAWIILRYRSALAQAEMWRREQWEAGGLLLVILSVTGLHWLLLAFRLRFLVNIPAWYWSISNNPFTVRDLLLTGAALAMFVLIHYFLIAQSRIKIGLLLVFLTGCLLQYGIGYLKGEGPAALRMEYISTYHTTYLTRAASNTRPILDNIRSYETLHGEGWFTGTKPPGLMVFYIALDRLVNGISPTLSEEARFERLSWFVTYSFPPIAMVMVFLLYAFTKSSISTYGVLAGRTAPVLFVLCPNVLLLTLYPDQAIYPICFMIGAWLAVLIIRSQSTIAGFLYGGFLYLAVFFAFTMLPLYPIAGLFLVIHYWLQRKDLRLKQQVIMGLAMAAGTILLYVLFRVLLNYDFFPRFERMVEINHNFDFYLRVGHTPPLEPESLLTRLQQSFQAAWANNLEFATTIGLPVFLLFLMQAARLCRRLIRGAAVPADAAPIAFLLAFLVLNAAGTAQGEVGRLWIFWAPMMLLFAAMELSRFMEKNRYAFLGLVILQFVTVLLTYHFQNLRM